MSRPRSVERRWLKWLLLSPVILLLVILLLPVLLIASLRWVDPYTSMFMLQRQYELWQADATEKVMYEWVDGENITPRMMLAVVAAEDQKFPVHFGFDLEAIEKAMVHNRGSKKIRGASTITQQVAKNLFLWPSRSWIRKGMEVYFTGLIEVFWSKQRIVEVYVNIAQFDENVFGVGAASKHFFKKLPDKLTMHETALLAAVLPSPKRYHAEKPSAFVLRRARWIQQQMYGLGDDYIATGIVPVRQYRDSTAVASDAVAVPMEEPVDELMLEPMDEMLDVSTDEFVDETAVVENSDTAVTQTDVTQEGEATQTVLPEAVAGDDAALQSDVVSQP
ncbi:MAG: monofunctional glycosyltransferase [Pseudomonadota bacterium]|nr:monofunctional glycosyltransferase [Pseudomonadota bacterium]